MRLIDADALESLYAGPFVQTYEDCKEELWNAPTIDAVPVVHARWKYPLGMAWNYVCSNCGFGNSSMIVKHNYCPNCGAKMDGDADA